MLHSKNEDKKYYFIPYKFLGAGIFFSDVHRNFGGNSSYMVLQPGRLSFELHIRLEAGVNGDIPVTFIKEKCKYYISSSSSSSGFYNALVGFSLLSLEVSRSHTMTHHNR
jgi:hypothetical protein